jgi:ornithine cyclodeaminase/alanine dehydrogenase-like protein (mu-crystallin family)
MSHDPPASEVLIVSGADVRKLMPMADCIGVVDRAMRVVSRGGAQLPLRIGAKIPGKSALCAAMPGYLEAPATLGAKVIAVNPENAQRGLSSHTGVVVLFDPERSVPIAIVDATAITGLRTAAASAVATNALARTDAADLAIIGTGEQAEAHVHAMAQVRKLRSIRVWGRSKEKATVFAAREGAALGLAVTVCETVERAVTGASIVCTTTSAREPILQGMWIERGTHVNLVGASSIDAREADESLVMKSRFFVDFRPSALAQAGELQAALPLGVQAKQQHIRGEIGEVLNGTVPGRTAPEDITVYKSLGIAAQDLATAHAVYERARQSGAGTRVTL